MASKALAKRPKTRTRTVVKTKWRTRSAKAKKTVKRRSAFLTGMPKKAAAAGAVGFLMGQPSVQEQVSKLPQIGNRTLTAGLALYFANKMILKNGFANAGAEAMIMVGAYEFGAQGFHLSPELADRRGYVDGVEGDDHHYDVSGTIDEDDAELDDDEIIEDDDLE